MPYIDQEQRIRMAHGVKPKLSGELNYAITKVIDDFLYDHKQHPRYDDFNTAIGVLECAKLELYRRRVALYEDGKLLENGEVYRG